MSNIKKSDFIYDKKDFLYTDKDFKHEQDFIDTLIINCDSYVATHKNLTNMLKQHKKYSDIYNGISKKIELNKQDFINTILSMYDIE